MKWDDMRVLCKAKTIKVLKHCLLKYWLFFLHEQFLNKLIWVPSAFLFSLEYITKLPIYYCESFDDGLDTRVCLISPLSSRILSTTWFGNRSSSLPMRDSLSASLDILPWQFGLWSWPVPPSAWTQVKFIIWLSHQSVARGISDVTCQFYDYHNT